MDNPVRTRAGHNRPTRPRPVNDWPARTDRRILIRAQRARSRVAALGVRYQRRAVLSLLLGLIRLGQSIARNFQDPAFRGLLLLYCALVLVGTVFYVRVESWSVLDAVYFCVVTMATVGYGDFAPRTQVGKVFTIVYVLIGTGVSVVLAAELALGVFRARLAPDADQLGPRREPTSRAGGRAGDDSRGTPEQSS